MYNPLCLIKLPNKLLIHELTRRQLVATNLTTASPLGGCRASGVNPALQPDYSVLRPVLPHLKRFDEGPQQGPNPLPARQQLHQPHHAEQPEEGDGDPGVLF